MARKKNLVPLFGVAFVVAIISTGVFYGLFVGKLNSASPSAASGGRVWVAEHAMAAGTVLKTENLKEINWPVSPLPAGVVAKLEEATAKTLVEPMAANQVLFHSHIAAAHGGSTESGGMGIPQGKRAVSLQVQDSAGVVAMLKPGHRVDVQVVGTSPGAQIQEPVIRTFLENMTVLTVPKDTGSRGGSQIVTVLASPREATLLGLADSTAKIRIALRNPIDQKQENPGTVGLSALFRGAGPVSMPSMNSKQTPSAVHSGTPTPAQTLAARPVQNQIELLVRVAGAEWEQIAPRLAPGSQADSLQVVALAKGEPFGSGVETISISRLATAKGREAGLRWTLSEKTGPDASCGLDIQFSPHIEPEGRVRVRVQPEVTFPGANGVNRRRLNTEVDVADGQSFLVRGFAAAADLNVLWERLFSRPAASTREIIVVVTPQIVREQTAKIVTPASE
ncbi:MAG: Flp pilus assembly protein CpaB [Acidobacteria bacterium]|nr:Flp pilus assembly protein CpaB [Acidobacteriota bacterium]